MNSKLYVGNLPFETKDTDLENLFSGSGKVVSVKIVKDRDSGRLKGFGFVEMNNSDEANSAIQSLNEKEFMGRKIRVNLTLENKSQRLNSRRY